MISKGGVIEKWLWRGCDEKSRWEFHGEVSRLYRKVKPVNSDRPVSFLSTIALTLSRRQHLVEIRYERLMFRYPWDALTPCCVASHGEAYVLSHSHLWTIYLQKVRFCCRWHVLADECGKTDAWWELRGPSSILKNWRIGHSCTNSRLC